MKERNIPERAVEYVLTRDIDELAATTVDNIAQTLGIHRSHLSRAFKERKSFTIEDFLFKVKLMRAAYLLEDNSDITIKEVSNRMGFCRCDYFIQVFRSFFGTTPAKYRELVAR